MSENELLDGDQFLAFQQGLEAKRRENILFVIVVLSLLGLFFFDVVNHFNLLIGLFFGGFSFIYTSIKPYFVYYYTWEKQTLILFTMSRFGKKGQVSFEKNAIKKIRASYFFLNKQGTLKITK